MHACYTSSSLVILDWSLRQWYEAMNCCTWIGSTVHTVQSMSENPHAFIRLFLAAQAAQRILNSQSDKLTK